MDVGMSSLEAFEEIEEPLRGVPDVVNAWADAILGKISGYSKVSRVLAKRRKVGNCQYEKSDPRAT